jgi:CrcB protein
VQIVSESLDARRHRRRNQLLIFVGGAIGTGLRYAAFRIWVHRPGTFPTTTLVVNCVGALILGAFAVIAVGSRNDADWHALFRVGLLGGFTTFSAYTVELAEFIRDDRLAIAASYAGAMTALGVTSIVAGMRLGHRLRAGWLS